MNEQSIGLLIGLGAGLIIAVISSLILFRRGIEHRKRVAEAEIGSAEKEGQRLVSEAEKIAERKKREALFEARDEIHRSRVDLEREVKERRL
ncbi:MAG: Rnase Y domain-containing protein, partial [Ruminiclostridium sp.]|nr:Rnase Y domain-containing protein [Ruminiclostridium sp.]